MNGFAALREGLVDDVGSLLDAVAIAAREAKLPAQAPVAMVYPTPDPAWKSLVLKAISEMNAATPGISVFSSLLLPGPWALWPEMPNFK
jgi:ClpP class serine protease